MAEGKPFPYDEGVFNEICDLIATSRKSLSSILTSDKRFPGVTTFYKWIDNSEDAAKNYARAKECQAHYVAEKVIEDAETPLIGIKTKETSEGVETTTGDNVERSRLMVDAGKWYAGKLLPKKYGNTLDVTSGGEVLQPMPAVNVYNLAPPLANSEDSVDE